MKQTKLLGWASTLCLPMLFSTANATGSHHPATPPVVPEPTPEYVLIPEDGITFIAGTGCPEGTFVHNVSPDRKAFTIAFSDFLAEIGPDSDPAAARSNCQISVDLQFPKGWSYSIASFDYRGFASLDPFVTATQQSTYYFQGDASEAVFETTIASENPRLSFEDDFHVNDELDVNAVVWSRCDATRALNISSSISVASEFPAYFGGFIALDSVDGELATIHRYHLRWRKCGDQDLPELPTQPVVDPRLPDDLIEEPLPPRIPIHGPPAGSVTIREPQVIGSGCPLGTVAKNVSADNQAFTLAFSDYVAEIGQGILRSQSRKNCQVILEMDYPENWTYSIVSFDFRGYADIDPNLRAIQQTNYYYQGDSFNDLTFSSELPILEPGEESVGFDGDWHYRDVIAPEYMLWAKCGERRALNINSSIRLSKRNRRLPASGFIAADSIDGEVKNNKDTFFAFGLQWRECPPTY